LYESKNIAIDLASRAGDSMVAHLEAGMKKDWNSDLADEELIGLISVETLLPD
jgi:hypothetical protein